MTDDLIYDLGFHNGDDTGFTLPKVSGWWRLKLPPDWLKQGLRRYCTDVKNGRLILLNKAISETSGKVDFFVHPTKPEWSSCLLSMAESDGSSSVRVSVDSTNLHELFHEYGVPHYLKVDVEGCDLFVAKQLSEGKLKPKFVLKRLAEITPVYSPIYMYQGTLRFQLINQINNPIRSSPVTVHEGKDVDFRFCEFSSGYFGDDLPKEKWLTFDELITRYIKYKELKQLDNVELGLGWLDVHARQ